MSEGSDQMLGRRRVSRRGGTGALSGPLPDMMRPGTGLARDPLQMQTVTVSTHSEPRIEQLESTVVQAGGQLEEVAWSVIDGDSPANFADTAVRETTRT